MKSSRVSRVVRILTTLQASESYSPVDLEKLLCVSRRTVFRDLKELQNIGVPYKFDKKRGGYSIDPKFFLPPIDFNLAEALSLLLLMHKISHHIPMPFANSALQVGLKIENRLPANIKEYCRTALQNISVSSGKSAGVNLLDNIFAELQKAIHKGQKVKLVYDSLFDKKVIETVLSPYHLMFRNRTWYVLGKSQLHGQVRTFNLGRIKSVEKTSLYFSVSDSFDVYDHFGKAWSMIPEGRIYDIKLRFLPKVAKNVSEVQWHCTQKNRWNEDGSVTVEFRVDGLGEIAWWILGYGDQVQILSPEALRKIVIQKAQSLIENNKDL